MKTLTSAAGFTKSQQFAISTLGFLILVTQLFCLFADFSPKPTAPTPEATKWLALQKEIDSLKLEAKNRKPTLYKFNPNFLTDYRGYKLGMSVVEIDRLFAFRKTGKYVNSAAEFQVVTHVSDSLLAQISPLFKFPDWVTHKYVKSASPYQKFESKPKAKIDINLATKDELTAIYGIGDALSDRILNQREKLGGFVDMVQMRDIWGLSDEVVANLTRRFDVKRLPEVKKIRINDASVKELAAFPYFRYSVAKAIVSHRTMLGKINNSDDLTKIDNFPVDNVKIISLYLEF